MVFRHISPDMKLRALALLQSGWEMADIVEALGVSKRSIARWDDNFDEYGRTNPRSVLQGRPRILNATVMAEIYDLIQETPSLFLDEIGEWLAIYHDQPISTTALHMNLCDLGLTYKQLRRTAAERDEVARAAWRHDLTTHFTAEQLVFIDESSKDDRTLYRHFGRAPAGERAVEVVEFDRGDRWSILPALTLDGYIAVRAVIGSIDGVEFYDFVVNDVVSSTFSYCPINALYRYCSCRK